MDFTNHRYNVNVSSNVNSKNLNNVELNVNVPQIVDTLRSKLGDTHSDLFFTKVAKHLPESFIWTQLEIALEKGRNPAAYFSSTCKPYLPS